MQYPDAIRLSIAKMVCPTHDIHPVVEQNWDEIQIDCCCAEFHKLCVSEREKLLSKLNLPDKLS